MEPTPTDDDYHFGLNLDPDGEDGDHPNSWHSSTDGITAAMAKGEGVDGGNCAVLRVDAGVDTPPSAGHMMRSIDATPYRGKVVRLRAALRHKGGPGRTQMWFRVDRERGIGHFDYMEDRPVQKDTWSHYETIGDVNIDAKSLSIGFSLIGEESTWVDDVSLEVLDTSAGFTIDPPRPLDGHALDNLVALTETMSLVRFFHPSDEAAETDWDAFAVHAMRSTEASQTPQALAQNLTTLFAPIAPSVRIVVTSDVDHVTLPSADKEHDVLSWHHIGFGQSGGAYSSTRERGKAGSNGLPFPDETVRRDLAGGVTVFVPLAVYADATGSLPRPTAESTNTSPALYYSGNDRATRLATVALAWGIFEHFYPYFDVVDVDWGAKLRVALAHAANSTGSDAFLWPLRGLVGALEDGHGHVSHACDRHIAPMPIVWAWAGDDLVAVAVGDDLDEISCGDVLVSINGINTEEWADGMRPYIAASSEQNTRYKLARMVRLGPWGGESTLRLHKADGSIQSVTAPYRFGNWPTEARPEPIEEIAPGVVYVDISRVDDATFIAAVPSMEAAKRIIFDFRGYPGNLSPSVLFGHLLAYEVKSAQWRIPDVRRPYETLNFTESNWPVLPAEPYFEAERVFITDGRAISYAETCMGIVEHFKLGEIVGEATAGTNGNVNPLSLPGGYTISWTGMKVLKHDGSQFHGVGILPTHPVTRTVDGIREGRDELLDAALALKIPADR